MMSLDEMYDSASMWNITSIMFCLAVLNAAPEDPSQNEQPPLLPTHQEQCLRLLAVHRSCLEPSQGTPQRCQGSAYVCCLSANVEGHDYLYQLSLLHCLLSGQCPPSPLMSLHEIRPLTHASSWALQKGLTTSSLPVGRRNAL